MKARGTTIANAASIVSAGDKKKRLGEGISGNHVSQYCRLEIHLRQKAADATPLFARTLLWEYPRQTLSLAREEIHLWRARLDQHVADLDQFNAMLSEDESGRATRYRFEKDRRRFVLRRALLRVILSRYLETQPALLQFSYGSAGKPALAHYGDDLHFNVSHSDGMALYAVTRDGPIGVDIERVRMIQEAEQISAQYFSREETTRWRSLPNDQQAECFLRHWSCKEAWLKMSGRGIFDAAKPTRSGTDPTGAQIPDAQTGEILYELTPATGYVAALALAIPSGARA
jgi:4'-phosphopantetheinyl transferase